jgi:hypothetical protein
LWWINLRYWSGHCHQPFISSCPHVDLLYLIATSVVLADGFGLFQNRIDSVSVNRLVEVGLVVEERRLCVVHTCMVAFHFLV